MLPTTPLLTRALVSLSQKSCSFATSASGLACLPQLLHAAACPWLHAVERHQPLLSLLPVRHLHAPSTPVFHKMKYDPLRRSPQLNTPPRTEWLVDPATIKHEPPGTVLQLPDGYDPHCPEPEYTIEGSIDGPYDVALQKVFAIVKVGNKQYKVTPRDLLYIDSVKCDINTKLALRQVLLLGSPSETVVGRPFIPQAHVQCVVEEQFLDAKKLVFKKRRRKNSRRLKGYRHPLTAVRIVSIHDGGVLQDGIPDEPVEPQQLTKIMRRF